MKRVRLSLYASVIVAFVVLHMGINASFCSSDSVQTTANQTLPVSNPRENQIIPLQQRQIQQAFGKLPMSFEPNYGQTDPKVKFLARGIGYTLFLTSSEAVLTLSHSYQTMKRGRPPLFSPRSPTLMTQSVLRMKLAHANPKPKIKGKGELPAKIHYFLDQDPANWHSGIPTYAGVEYADVYPGVSVQYYGKQQQLEYDFLIKAGCSPRLITLQFQGAKRMRLDANGKLILTTTGGEIHQPKPFAYQETEAGRKAVPASYIIVGKRKVRFKLGAYDKRQALIIDPVLSYSTYLGGNNGANIEKMTVDGFGNVCVAGTTTATNFPTTAKAYRRTFAGPSMIFVSQINSTGTGLLFSSYLASGSLSGIAVDNSNNAYITGAASAGFPTTAGAFQTTSAGGSDVFVTKLNMNAANCTPDIANQINCKEALAYSTLLGGTNDDYGFAIAIDPSGNAYITGQTNSGNFPTTPGVVQPTQHGGWDAFVTKVNATGTALTYSTFLGGAPILPISTGDDDGLGIAVDTSGRAYVTGWTNSASFPTTSGAIQTACTNCSLFNPSAEAIFDAFVTKLNSTGTGFIYSTYLGGSLGDAARDIAIDSSGNAYITGQAASFDFPTTSGAVQSGSGGVLKSLNGGAVWDATGAGVATAIGDTVKAIAIDPTNPAIIYAGIYTFNGESGVMKSTDGGNSWTRMNNGFTATNVNALAIAPTVPPTIYAGMDLTGIYKSTDGGQNWVEVNTGLISPPYIASLAADPSNPLTVYAGGLQSGISKTTDGGNHWTITSGPATTRTLVFHPTNPSTIFAGATNSVDKSTDGGITWNYIGQGITTPLGVVVKALVIDPTNPLKMLAGTDHGIFKTVDGVSTPWVPSNNGLGSTFVHALAIDRANPSIIYAGTANGIYKSYDGGNTWKSANRGLIGSGITSLAIDPAKSSSVYAGAIGSSNLFVSKLNSTGTALVYSTHLTYGTGPSIAIDTLGNAYIAGQTPGGFPVTEDAIQPTFLNDDAFLAKLNTTGTALLYATYLGGSGTDWPSDIATDASGNVYLAGKTSSTDFPTTPGVLMSTLPGLNFQGFVSKIAIPVTADYDSFSVSTNNTLTVPAPGVLANDRDVINGQLTAVLTSGTANGTLNLSSNGAFVYTPNQNFTGFDSFKYKVQSSTGAVSNIAEVTIQVSFPSCEPLTSPNAQSVPDTGGTGTVMITAGPTCRWTAYSNSPSFITITSAGSGLGNAIVSYTVAANPSAIPRIGTLTVAGHTVVITQSLRASISGSISYCAAAVPLAMSGVKVSAMGTSSTNTTTDANGQYQLSGLVSGPYTVTPSKTGDGNGITSYDAALVAQHVAGSINLSTCKQTAADVNNSGGLSAEDAAIISQKVAGLPADGLVNTWKFAPPNRTYSNLTSNQTGQNFDAILIGEVSGNWSASGLSRPNTTSTTVTLSLPTTDVITGSDVSLPITVGDLSGLGVVSFDINIKFNSAVIEPLPTPFSTAATLCSGFIITPNTLTPGSLTISAYGVAPISGSGTLLNLLFHVNGAEGTSTSLDWKLSLLNEGDPGVIPINGNITVNGQPSAIKLRDFQATEYDNGVFFEWNTGLEVGNLGFNLYREKNRKREPVNQHLIAGSALRASPYAVLQSGESYSWWENSTTKDAIYWLEDIDLKGGSTWHGPFFAKSVGGSPPPRSNAALISHLGNKQENTSKVVESVAELSTASSTRPLTEPLNHQLQIGGLAAESAVKIAVKREGLYRVTQPELVAAGFSNNAEADKLQLFVDGREQPIVVSAGKNGRFDESAFIEFYGLGLDTPSTDARIYWLIIGKQAGKRIQKVEGKATPSSDNSFTQTVERRDRSVYFSALRNGEKENFFGAVISNNPVEQGLNLPHALLASPEQAIIEIALQGVTQLPHRVSVQLNGSVLGDLIFNGQEQGRARFTINHSLLREGENTVRLVAQNGAGDVSLVEVIRLSYQHTFTADEDSLQFTTIGRQQVTLDGFASKAIRVFDVTDEDNTQELLGEIEQTKNGYTVTVATTETGERKLLAITTEQMKKVAASKPNYPSKLRSNENATDFLIIAAREFFSAIEPLKARRQADGYKVELVDVEDIYDEFSFGHKTPQAMREFFTYAKANWKVAPRFALIVGDASYDAKNYLGLGEVDLVPTKLIDTSYLETASDDWFTDFNSDGIGDIAIGRLPVRRVEEAKVMVNKILRYAEKAAPESVLLVSDANDEFNFEQASAALKSLLPTKVKTEEVQRGQLPAEAAKRRLLESLSKGQMVVNYAGHGSVNQWRESLLTAEEARTLTNENLPVFVMMTCLNGYYHHAELDSLGEALLKAESGGAIAVWASTGLTFPQEQAVVNQELYRLLFAVGNASLKDARPRLTLGEAVQRAKAIVPSLDVRRTWILLGDPTLQLK